GIRSCSSARTQASPRTLWGRSSRGTWVVLTSLPSVIALSKKGAAARVSKSAAPSLVRPRRTRPSRYATVLAGSRNDAGSSSRSLIEFLPCALVGTRRSALVVLPALGGGTAGEGRVDPAPPPLEEPRRPRGAGHDRLHDQAARCGIEVGEHKTRLLPGDRHGWPDDVGLGQNARHKTTSGRLLAGSRTSRYQKVNLVACGTLGFPTSTRSS